MPVLELRSYFKAGIKIAVTNKGAGEAVIEDIKLGKLSPSTYLYSTYGDHMLEKAKQCAKVEYPNYNSAEYFTPTTDRHFIRPGEEFDLVDLHFKDEKNKTVDFTEDQSYSYHECVDDTNVQICYCSISGRTCNILSSRNYIDSDFLCPPPPRRLDGQKP